MVWDSFASFHRFGLQYVFVHKSTCHLCLLQLTLKMENQILQKLFSSFQSNKDTIILETQEKEPNLEYYQFYKTLTEHSNLLFEQFLIMQSRHKTFENRLQKLKEKANTFKDFIKRDKWLTKNYARRGSNNHRTRFHCPIPHCNLSYGSRSSYRVHLKKKHPQYKKDEKSEDLQQDYK